MKTKISDTRLGTLAIERGLLSQGELDALVARADAGKDKKSVRALLGETLIRERVLGAQLLGELLQEQRHRMREAAPPAKPLAATSAPGALEAYLKLIHEKSAREVLLIATRVPAVRVFDRLEALETPALTAETFEKVVAETFSAEQRDEAAKGAVASATFTRPFGRFRATLGSSEQGGALSIRPIGLDPRKDPLRLPASLANLANLRRGLVLVTGPRASIRENVLAQLVAAIADKYPRHIIAIERNPTYDLETKRALVAQREVGVHTKGYETALRAALREDPDVIAIGEMREPDAIATALLAAETGHLVIAGVHAADATQALRRVIDAQRVSKRSLVRATLANTLQAVAVCDAIGGRSGRPYLVADLVPGTPAVANIIREDRLHHLDSIARNQPGAVSRDVRLAELVGAGEVSHVAALECARDPDSIPALERKMVARG